MRRVVAATCLAAAVIALAAPTAFAAPSAAPAPVTATFTINGRSVAHAGDSNPIRLDPTHPAKVNVTVTNNSSTTITIASVALSGRALDITFFDFETQTALQVPPASTQSQQYVLDFAPLNGQGDGLIPASIQLLDIRRHRLAGRSFTADVRGRITSLFGLFAIEVTLFTAILFAGALLALARGRLHENRFRRGVRFLWPGIGLGIVIVFVFAILRIWVPRPGRWLPIVLLCAAVGFAVGYLTPHPETGEVEPEPEADARLTAAEPEAGEAEPAPRPAPAEPVTAAVPPSGEHEPVPRPAPAEPVTAAVPAAADPRATLTPGGLPARAPDLVGEE